MNFTDIELAQPFDGVALIRLNRPKAMNALRNHTLSEICQVLEQIQNDTDIHCLVITGTEQIFAAGADIKEVAELNPLGVLNDIRPEYWKKIRHFPKPILAAVNGFALGAGCELMMHTDIVIAGETAQIGQPEIKLGLIPGAGGTQRLYRIVGKSRAMQMVLTGEPISAKEAQICGLISEITLPELTLERALKIAQCIAKLPPVAVKLAKETLLKANELTLEAGLDAERKAFALLAATEDRQEGISAFIEKRAPHFKGH